MKNPKLQGQGPKRKRRFGAERSGSAAWFSLSADIRRLHLPPRGKEKIAQGKGAQRLPPWVNRPLTTIHYFVTPDCASLVRGYSHIVRDFGLARCARK